MIQVVDFSGHLNLAEGQHDQVVSHPFQFGHHVRGQHHRYALRGHRLHHGLDEVVPGQRVERRLRGYT